MNSGGRKDNTEASPSAKSSSAADEQGLLTSEDLFGDLIDAPLPSIPAEPATSPAPPPRRAPIRVQVCEPGVPKRPAPPRPKEVLPQDVALLLDAFSEPGEAATRAEAAPSEAPSPARPAASPVSSAPAEAPDAEALLDALVGSEPEAAPEPLSEAREPAVHERVPSARSLASSLREAVAEEADLLLDLLMEPVPAPAAPKTAPSTDPLLAGILEPPKPAPPPKRPPTPDRTLPPTHVDALLDFAELRKGLPMAAPASPDRKSVV